MRMIEPCSHYREGDYGTRCKSGFVQSSACAGVGVVSLRDYPCCKEEFCGRIYADHGGKPEGPKMTQHADILKRLRHQQAASERGEPSSYVIDIWRCAADEIERLQTENWQLKQACGYPIPADKETINNPFKCGICDARHKAEQDNRE